MMLLMSEWDEMLPTAIVAMPTSKAQLLGKRCLVPGGHRRACSAVWSARRDIEQSTPCCFEQVGHRQGFFLAEATRLPVRR